MAIHPLGYSKSGAVFPLEAAAACLCPGAGAVAVPAAWFPGAAPVWVRFVRVAGVEEVGKSSGSANFGFGCCGYVCVSFWRRHLSGSCSVGGGGCRFGVCREAD